MDCALKAGQMWGIISPSQCSTYYVPGSKAKGFAMRSFNPPNNSDSFLTLTWNETECERRLFAQCCIEPSPVQLHKEYTQSRVCKKSGMTL